MRSILSSVFALLLLSVPLLAQVRPPALTSEANLSFGGGTDYWRGDWGKIARYGPAAWASTELKHGIGICADSFSMLAGGSDADKAEEYKYVVGEGGAMYTYHWRALAPYFKGELGFGSLGFPHKPTSVYGHDTRTTWAIGGGTETRFVGHLWLRADYTYNAFPDFYSPITKEHHTLNPAGVAIGVTYHLH
jgi:opacity protein-like surface antigen